MIRRRRRTTASLRRAPRPSGAGPRPPEPESRPAGPFHHDRLLSRPELGGTDESPADPGYHAGLLWRASVRSTGGIPGVHRRRRRNA